MKRLLLFLIFCSPCFGAISFVNSGKCTAPSSSSTTQTCTTGWSPANGNTLFVWAYHDNTSTLASADGEGTGNSYTKDCDITFSTTARGSFFRASNVSGSGTYTITITSGSAAFTSVIIAEYSGLANSSVTDGACKTATGTSTSDPTAGTFTTTNANDLLVAAFGSDSGLDVSPVTSSDGTYTVRQSSGNGSTDFVGGLSDSIKAATGTYTDGFHITANENWWAIHAAYKQAGAGATTPANQFPRIR
jgi:hypothetical protein